MSSTLHDRGDYLFYLALDVRPRQSYDEGMNKTPGRIARNAARCYNRLAHHADNGRGFCALAWTHTAVRLEIAAKAWVWDAKGNTLVIGQGSKAKALAALDLGDEE